MGLVNTWYGKTNMSTMKLAAKEYIILLCKATAEKKLEEFKNVFQCLLQDASEKTANAKVAESTADGDAAENADGDDLAADDESDEKGSDAEAAEFGAGDA